LAQNYDVHALSHPGFGGSDLPNTFTTVDDLAYHYLDYLEAEGLDDVIVVGASFGGWIAAEIAVKASPRITALILIDAYGIKVGSRDQFDVADIFYLLPEKVREMGWHTLRPGMSAATLEGARRIARNRESLCRFGWSPLLHNPRLAGRLHGIGIPALVLWGASDRLAPVEYGRAYAAAIPGSSFRLIDAAGHLPHVEQYGATATRIEKFLGSIA
jgi:pimeloyl-ACP methyl ester carboxylesterase